MARATAKEEAEMTETKGGGRRGSDGEAEGQEIEVGTMVAGAGERTR